jgi:hypothetical protein
METGLLASIKSAFSKTWIFADIWLDTLFLLMLKMMFLISLPNEGALSLLWNKPGLY